MKIPAGKISMSCGIFALCFSSLAAQGKRTDAKQTNNPTQTIENAQVTQGSPMPAKINANSMAILAKGYAGYGQPFALMGVGIDSKVPGSIYAGNGFSVGLNPLVSWKFLALEPGLNFYTYSQISAYKYTTAGKSTEAKPASGNTMVLDLKGGFKLFTEKDDMGYTFVYAGFRYWKTNPRVEIDNYNISSSGWIAGYRDYSTFRLSGAYALAVTTGIWITQAPAKGYTENGTDNLLSGTKGIGAGYEFLLGLAVEDIGLGIDVGIRTDLITTSGLYANNSYALFAFGSTAGVLQLQYVF